LKLQDLTLEKYSLENLNLLDLVLLQPQSRAKQALEVCFEL